MKLSFKLNKPVQQISDRVTGGDAGQLFLANEAKKLMDPYVPALNLGLSRNVRVYVEGGKGIIHYLSPHARYQFRGRVMISKNPGVKESAKIVKQPEQELKYSTFRHPLATSHWDKAMMTARKDDLVRAVQNYVEGKSDEARGNESVF